MLLSAADASSAGVSRVLVLDRYGVVQVDAYSQLNGRRFENAEVANVLSGQGGGLRLLRRRGHGRQCRAGFAHVVDRACAP